MSAAESDSPEGEVNPHPEVQSRGASDSVRETEQQEGLADKQSREEVPSHGVTITVEDADADEPEEEAAEDGASQRETPVVTESQTEPEGTPIPQEEAEDTSAETVPTSDQVQPEEQQQDEGTPAAIPDKVAPETRPSRSDSRSTTVSRPPPVNSTVFVVSALETIAAAKEVRKNKEFADAVQAALSNIKNTEQAVNPEIIFRPLQMATKSFNVPLQVTALDCIGKLISYSYFAFPVVATNQPGEENTPPLIERAIEAICDCFENEATPVEIQQQIIKSLLAAVLDDKIVVHGAGLLKAVRQIYNIFIYSKASQNQQVAQGSLLQMIATVFERVRVRLELKEARLREQTESKVGEALAGDELDHPELNGLNGQTETPDQEIPPALPEGASRSHEKLTLQSFENNKTLDDAVVADSAPTTVTRARRDRKNTRSSTGPVTRDSLHEDHDDSGLSPDDEDDIYIKDAFLVFRSLCKLSQKVLSHDQQQDLKSQNMRSKLLSLHLIYHVLNNYTIVFTSSFSTIKSGNNDESTPFLQVAKPHLCLSLSRNAASSVPRVYEVCCEIFWFCLKHLRVLLKKELEVFLKEIYLAVLERRSAPPFQKQMFLDILEQLAGDPRALVEIYLNYDCDRTALNNMYQEIIEHLARICSTPVIVSPQQQQQYQEQQGKQAVPSNEWHAKGALLPGLSTASLSHPPPPPSSIPVEYTLKQQSLRCLVEILRSLDNWSSHAAPDGQNGTRYPASRESFEESRESLDYNEKPPPSPRVPGHGSESGVSTPVAEDDPNEIEKIRERKSALKEAIRLFNFKPKRGIKALLAEGFIRSNTPQDIARFLYGNDRIDKTALGEYLGEGDEHNVAIMHAFVDMMDFSKRRFVDALRQFLQSFRLPGEAQKIDRFMLKFAERYLSGNPNAFANADTAYVLAYSAVMLNTDQHSTKLKGARMTVEDFIKNNRGINDGQDLPAEYLASIYEDIATNEIVLASEREHAAELGLVPHPASAGLASRAGQVFANVGRDLQKEKYAQASEEMANKTEQLYRSLIRAQKRSAVREALSRFIPATSVKHVGPMFNVTWMSFLSAFSSQMQDAHNLDLIRQCLEGFRLAIRIACRFDLETPRVAFVTALAKFTNLGNLKEMIAKNLEALKVLIEVALTEGDGLKSSWREVLMCISQLDRLQLLSTGIDEGAIPDVTRANIPTPSNSSKDSTRGRRSMQAVKRPRPRSSHSFRPEVADETKSTDMIRGVDRIFTNTSKLSSEAIIDFVRALSEVSWQEIQSSGNSESPRTYSLQKIVEISYYNMTRVRIEWTRIWEVLGDHFNQVGCHNNTAVVFFALDSLRQLSMRFLEFEELPGFKFQKDFLKPFEHVMANSNVVSVKDMVLRCLIQMIQARGDNIRSGWKTMFGVFSVAAREQYESIVNIAFDYTNQIYNTRFGVVISQGSFPDLIICLTEFSKNLKFQKKSLQAIELLKSTVPKMLKTPECPLSRRHIKGADSESSGIVSGVKQPTSQTEEEQFWYPVLIAYQDVLMTGEDLEVRSRALTYLFETLIRYGGDFPTDFWDVLWRQLLYPIFVVLQSKSEMSKAPNHEELSVWLSTTMIQALRNMITLFTHYFESLEHMLDRFLDLLTLCICQENDTIARIGSNCLQQLILQNVTKFTPEHWSRIVTAFVELFNRTTAYELFSAAATMSDARPTPAHDGSDGLSISGTTIVETPTTNGDQHYDQEAPAPLAESQAEPTATTTSEVSQPQMSPELEDYRPHSDMQATAPVVTAARRRFFNKIITNCVLQLLMIETVAELFSNDSVYAQIPSSELLRLMALLKKSYQFAKKFNGDKELRMALWRQGFMRQPPNLLKQESGSANTYVSILLRMYHDEGEERRSSRDQTEGALIPLCADIIRSFIVLDEETQQRNIVAWRPVVIDVLEGYTNFPKDSFDKHIDVFYPLAVGLLEKEVNADLRAALWGMFRRVGEVKFNMPELVVSSRGRDDSVSSTTRNASVGGATPTSPGQSGRTTFDYATSNNSRRSSRVSRTGVA
ncbi:guanine nucleotide exchange protein for ADP-robosylation factor [Exophiala dermatitidis]|uniref:Guanine nucleotide exchange protein for ADP-robosylation factor n=1 Tax=Exophiala dermatitidis TaxID=5970 RepID=A0AAN6F4Y0_EXODE|nr:guanine nucleotide exchange protein for ADP-robosylation factor [Exophiala dermatitidis]KAJ4528107.1 guanine nucleotide exchange protein for ADP-robosylation factor [Exophiala dermatitidis]KAJ4528740.1 guanine nucleotide exchange protein for ADP-robosylation factor [Exophiala dermatitidis]KAJ4530126.1 guanine nucleotide exchange protein for ADP-robosylation factor [Exophiala dermatitidis]KAJ4553072.1 guanine nucleotide exchange protein for ADP-robosylation factor [Exophiala dermatitidis]